MASARQESKQDEYDLSIHLLDADGTIFNGKYYQVKKIYGMGSDKKAILAANKKLIAHIEAKINAAKIGGYIESFSMRQTRDADQDNATARQTSSFFTALPILHEDLSEKTKQRCKFEKFLMGDLCTGSPAGTCFDSPDPEFAKQEIIYDPTKISMLYAKMQRAALENPGKKIHITVWDDCSEILAYLHEFFSDDAHMHLIPQGITVSFMHHNLLGDHFEETFCSLIGTGKPNKMYQETVMQYYQSAGFAEVGKIPMEELLERATDDIVTYYQDLAKIHQVSLDILSGMSQAEIIARHSPSEAKSASPVPDKDKLDRKSLSRSSSTSSLSSMADEKSEMKKPALARSISVASFLAKKHEAKSSPREEKKRDRRCTF